MNDPHIESLTFRAEAGVNVRYEAPTPLTGETPEFVYCLEQQQGARTILTVRMKTHCAIEADALAIVAPFLRSWEVHTQLHGDVDELTFHFEKAAVIDRSPPTDGQHAHSGAALMMITAG